MGNIITAQLLKHIAPNANDNIIGDIEKFADSAFEHYQINNYLRICHFIAQAAEESDGFKTLQEYASGRAYEGRQDLGNVNPGDGVRYKGRGIFELTGRGNYADMSKILGVDLVNHPELAATGEISLKIALEYWNHRNLSAAADNDDINMITHRINGGYNGLATRQLYLDRAKAIVPKMISFNVAAQVQPPIPSAPVPEVVPPAVIMPAKPAAISPAPVAKAPAENENGILDKVEDFLNNDDQAKLIPPPKTA